MHVQFCHVIVDRAQILAPPRRMHVHVIRTLFIIFNTVSINAVSTYDVNTVSRHSSAEDKYENIQVSNQWNKGSHAVNIRRSDWTLV